MTTATATTDDAEDRSQSATPIPRKETTTVKPLDQQSQSQSRSQDTPSTPAVPPDGASNDDPNPLDSADPKQSQNHISPSDGSPSPSTHPTHAGTPSTPSGPPPLPNTKPKPNSTPFPPLNQTSTRASARATRAASALSAWADSPENPLNWPKKKKWIISCTVALTGFISTSGSSIGVPGLYAASQAFGVDNEKVGTLIPGAYVLGLGAGPFLFSPIAELYGRQVAYVSAQTFYVVFFLATGFSNSMVTLIVLRFFCGAFGSVGPSLGVATIADMFAPAERGTPLALYAIGPTAGPILGNMLGYWILFAGWRWAYYIWTIVAFANYFAVLFVLQETYAPVLQKILTFRARELAAASASSNPTADSPDASSPFNLKQWFSDLSWMRHMVSRDEAREMYGRAFSRPPRLLFTNPVSFVFSMYYAYVYSIIYLFLVALPLLFGRAPFSHASLFSYEWPQAVLSLAYIPIGIGFFLAITINAKLQSRIYVKLSERHGDKGQPEYRLVLTQLGMCLMPIGLLIFGWTANAQTHWMGPFVGQTIIGIGLMLAFNTLQAFFVDAFHPYSAAAVAAATAARSITACILPIFASEMFIKLGWGWGGTLLALIAVLGIPWPLVMFVWGKRLRERYAFNG